MPENEKLILFYEMEHDKTIFFLAFQMVFF